MPRPLPIKPNIHIHTTIDADLADTLHLHLFSLEQQCVPRGAYKEFLEALLRDYFKGERYYLPSGKSVRGSPEAILELTLLIGAKDGSSNTP